MAENSLIAWCHHTFNPWLGCFKVSQGCTNCYADALLSGRMGRDVFGPDLSKRQRTGKGVWNKPPKWNEEARQAGVPVRVFCASLADVFEDAPGPNEWRADVWHTMHATPWIDWLVLTKRPENVSKMLPDTWGDNRWGAWPNVWIGSSIEDNRVAERSEILAGVPAFRRFISYEPAIGTADEVPLEGIDWVICGGESGPGHRKLDIMWAYEMWSRCLEAGIPFFFKQDSGPRTEMGIDALGKIVREYPQSWDRAELRLAA